MMKLGTIASVGTSNTHRIEMQNKWTPIDIREWIILVWDNERQIPSPTTPAVAR